MEKEVLQRRPTLLRSRGDAIMAFGIGLLFLASTVTIRGGLHGEVNPLTFLFWVGCGIAATRLALTVWRPHVWPGWRILLRRTGPAVTLIGWISGMAVILGPPNDPHALDQRKQSRCYAQLDGIAFAIKQYVDENGGHYPERPEALLPDGVDAAAFVCPSTQDLPAVGATPKDIADALASGGHLSYVYAGKGLTTATTRPDSIVFYEPARNHTRDHPGFHVLYAGERIEYLEGDTAQKFMTQIRVQAWTKGRELSPR